MDEKLASYMREHKLSDVAVIDPDGFSRWVFPKLFRSRIPRYEKIARDHGYIVTTVELAAVKSEADFLALVERSVERSFQPGLRNPG